MKSKHHFDEKRRESNAKGKMFRKIKEIEKQRQEFKNVTVQSVDSASEGKKVKMKMMITFHLRLHSNVRKRKNHVTKKNGTI